MAPEKALDRILEHPQPAALVHAFPEEDLHILIREIGADDALPLIALASHKQREYLLDQEIWQRDRIDLEATGQWFDRFLKAEASPGRMIDWLTREKTDLVELFLFRSIDVRIREHDQDPSIFGAGFYSYDNVFYIRIAEPPPDKDGPEQAEASEPRPPGIVRQLLDHMAANDYVRLQSILLEAANVLPAETEEEAYRLRSVRLAEKGFLPFEEAVGLYQPLNPQQFPHKAGRQQALEPEQPDLYPLVPTALLAGGNLFTQALERFDRQEQRQALQEEFAALCNRIVVADRQTIDRREALADVVSKASGYIHIGLQKRLPGQPTVDAAVRELSQYQLEGLFRLGYGEAVRLKRAAEAWVHQSWFAGRGLSLTFWGESWLGVLGGLLLKRPLFFDNYRTGTLYREFADRRDIRWSRQQLEDVQAIDHLLGRLNPDMPPAASTGFLTYKNLLLTLWARHCLSLSEAVQRIGLPAFQSFFRDLFQPGKSEEASRGGRCIGPDRRRDFLDWLADGTRTDAAELSVSVGRVLETLFAELEEAYGRVRADDIDPRYIHHFLLESPPPQ
jgi:hypothetical protein